MHDNKIQVMGYRLDDIFLDVRNRQLWRNGKLLPLTSKYLDVLLLLLRNRGQLVEKQRIFEEVWNGVIVTDAALTQCIKDIRKQLGDDATHPRYIKTIPKHGYIFIGHVTESLEEREKIASGLAVSISQTAALGKVARPYKFLDYYTEHDAPLFFGREREIETICSQILAHRTFILHGRSGVGKSSILRAGLMPRLKSQGHLAFAMRCFPDPLLGMRSSLAEMVEAAGGLHEGSQLEEAIRQLGSMPNRLVIFFLDQFEEFFLLLGEASRQRFVETLGKVFVDEALPLRLVFALREDLLAEMSHFKPAVPEIFHHEYRLKRLTREQAGRAITEPARAVGCFYEERLVARLLDDLAEGDSIDPPQLQIVCDNLYDVRDPAGKLTVTAYERLGGASQILAGYLERVLLRFKPEDLRTAKEILIALISAEGQRLVLGTSELLARVRKRVANGSTSVPALVEELIAARIVRCRNQDGEAWLELSHDFLIAEISRWQTDAELALKRARGVLERAMENYRAHHLIIDADALDLLLPFGAQLGLNGEEADLLMMSALHRARPVPQWLVHAAPAAANLIADASLHPNPTVRLRAVEACRWRRDQQIKELLRHLALWDRALLVRKAASTALADWFGAASAELLLEEPDGKKLGLTRRALSLALIRDYDKSLIRLANLSLLSSAIIILSLVWVRLRRNARDILRRGLGATLGGAASGLTGGLMLGLALAMARHTTYLEATSLIIVLISLGLFIGALGSLGVGFAMITAAHITYRHSRWWSVLGGAAGGAVIGGLINLLGMDTLRALFGQSPREITGAFEGGVIGAGVSLGTILSGRLTAYSRVWHRIASAALGAMLAAILLTVIGGNLFSGSLELVARSFANSQMRMDPLATFFGEVQFGRTTQIILGAIEGLLFGAGMSSGMELVARSRREK